jgi:hypothetical protein
VTESGAFRLGCFGSLVVSVIAATVVLSPIVNVI